MKTFFTAIIFSLFVFFLNAQPAIAQTVKLDQPRQDKLLNGLNLLVWNDPSQTKATVKLRIHSGAAFDPKDKTGVMALLGDILFPTDQTREFFKEDLAGSLDVETNYDYIQITATGKTEELLAILETLATAVTKPQITKENLDTAKQARLAKLTEWQKNPDYVAARTVAGRLYGEFPYGRSPEGTIESLAKIDRADLLLADQRFFTADNATLTVVGNVDTDFVYRAVRRLFGGWNKSEQKVPATFRMPDPLQKGENTIEIPNAERIYVYQASRWTARNSKDYYAGLIAADILNQRVKQIAREMQIAESDKNIYVRDESYLLNGSFTVGINLPANQITSFLKKNHEMNFLREISDDEFTKSKSALIAETLKNVSDKNALADIWLDTDTYKLLSPNAQIQNLQTIELADVRNVMKTFLKDSPFVEVLVGDPVKLKEFQASMGGQMSNK